jgi:hypothetical protein
MMTDPGFVRGETMSVCRLFALAGAVASAVVCAAACGRYVTGPGPVAYCTAVAPIAISITVRDSVTGRALADSASGTARLGTATDTLLHVDSLTLIGGRQIGTYDVTVQRAGFRTWTRAGVAATQTNACGGVQTVMLLARLQSP